MQRAQCAHWAWLIASVLGVTLPAGAQLLVAPAAKSPVASPTNTLRPSATLAPVSPIPQPQLAEPTPFTTPTGALEASAPPVRMVALQNQNQAQLGAIQRADVPPEAPQPPDSEASEIEVPFTDEPFELDIPEEIGKLQSVFVRPRAMAETYPVTPPPEQGPPFLTVIAKRKGRAEITLVGERGTRKYRFSWVPSLRDVESILLHQFPNSSLRLTQVAENIVIVEGAVDSASEIEPILTLLENFLSRGGKSAGKVINAMQVVGPMQVQLEVLIARVDRAKLRQLGFNFTQSDGPWYSGSQLGNIINTPMRTAH